MSTQKRRDEDFAREIRAHVDIETTRLIEEGMPPDQAREAARRAFGNVTRAQERYYERSRWLWADHLRHDLRCGIRNIRRYPVAALVAVISLAGGIGATTVTLMVRDVLFLRAPRLYVDPAALSRVQIGSPERPIMPMGNHVPAALYASWRDALDVPMAAAALSRGMRDMRIGDRTEPVQVRAVTPGFFELLGVRPEAGHLPAPDTATGAGPAPALLSYRVWERLFDKRQDAIGRPVWIDNQPYTVVGVLPRPFWFSDWGSPVWTLLDPRAVPPDEGLEMIVRRPAALTPALLDARLQGGLAEYARRLPSAQRDLRLKVSGVEGTPIARQVAPFLPYVLGASVLLTLLIACANVAILMIAQWTAREHEIAIRASIGASRGRIIRALLTESVLVASLGGLAGVGATLALRAVVLWRAGGGSGEERFVEFTIDPVIFLQAAVITVLTGMIAGIAPALYETRRLHTNPLRTLATSDRVRQRWRHTLVIAEIVVTVALFVETAAMIDGYKRTRSGEMGFATRPLMTAVVENPAGIAIGPTLDAIKQLPGIARVAVATAAPYSGAAARERVAGDAGGSNAVLVERATVTGEFFATLGVSLRAGRTFSSHDSAAARIAVASESLAKRLFPGTSAVGQRIWIAGAPHDIVGVVADYAHNPMQAPSAHPRVFLPLANDAKNLRRLAFVIRAESDPGPLVQPVRRQAPQAAPGTIVTSAYTFDQIREIGSQEVLIGSAPLVPLIAIGTLLTTAGIYGVLAFAITRRSRELAVRMAIGASRSDVVRLVAAHTLRLVGIGATLGIALTFALARVVRASGGAGSILDPPAHVFVWPVIIVIVLGALATWVPSRRALRINPAVLLRST
jgi:putative ABC transport system permease protein